MRWGRWAVLALVLAACSGGAGEPATDDTSRTSAEVAATTDTSLPAATRADSDARSTTRPPTPSAAAAGTVITTGDSEFGEMLFDERDQAIYLFEPESDGVPACYGACETAWPPVLTEGAPQATGNTQAGLLGTVVRRDGSSQVTYNGQPLYFYANEAPGQVLCHDVVLNGGLWLAVGPGGSPLPA